MAIENFKRATNSVEYSVYYRARKNFQNTSSRTAGERYFKHENAIVNMVLAKNRSILLIV